MRSYQNVVEIILEIAKKHKWIKSVDAGDISQKENSLSYEYPLFFIQYDTISINERSKIYNFEFVIAEKTTLVQSTANASNQLQVLSDCDAVMTDILSYLYHLELKDFIIRYDTLSAQPFLSGLFSGGVGLIYSVQIEVPYSRNSCDSMITDVVLPNG